MKISVKLVSLISIFNIIGIGLVSGFTLIRSQQEISRLADAEAKVIAEKTGEHIGKWFETYIVVIRTIAQVIKGYQSIPAEQRRGQFNFMMQQALIENPELQSIYANWSPNGLDGMDEFYANTPGTDETGRFIPAWSRSGNRIVLNYVVGFGWDMIQAMNFQDEHVLDPSVYTSSEGKKVLIANMGSAVKDNGVHLGSIGCTMEMATLQSMVNDIKPFGDGHAFLFSAGGIIAAHSDPARLGKNMRETEQDTFGPFLDTLVDAVTNGKPASFSYRPQGADTVMQYYSVPFTIGRYSHPWTLVISVSQDTIMAPVYRMIRICLIIGVLSIALMLAGVLFIAHSISRPIKTLTLMLKDLSEGEGDLTKTITIKDTSEIGDLAHYFNRTIGKIRNLVLSIRKEAAPCLRPAPSLPAI
jgi:methyl-accepting chemotaxis protein